MIFLESRRSHLVQLLTEPNDPGTVLLTGDTTSILVMAALVALPVSIALLRHYRRAVLRSMGADARPRADEPLAVETPTTSSRSAQRVRDFPTLDHASSNVAESEAHALYSSLLRGPWRAAAIYAAAGSCYALVMAAASLAPVGLLPLRFLIIFWCYAWPVVLAVNLVAAATWRAELASATVYFFVLMTLGAMANISRPISTPDFDPIAIPWWGQIAGLWLITNLPATLLLWAFLNRRIRAVGPLVLTFLVLAFTGLDISLGHIVLGEVERSGAYSVFIGLIVLGIAVFGLSGWLALRWIGARYEHKKISDQSVTLDSMWLMFAAVQSINLFFGGAVWILSGLFAFAAYKVVVRAGFSLLGRETAPESPPKLLLLRVFALGKRSEQLFDALTKHWRHVGSISFIAGPDLLTTTVEPHEFLDFLSGKLARRFIDGSQTLDLRISEMDLEPDRDGRFRVNDFFCHDDTWQMVLSQLEGESDAVLMDLRGFSQENRGVIYEMNELINVVPLERVVFIIDRTTDEAFLSQIVQECWEQMKPTSPNRLATPGQLRLFRYTSLHGGELRQLLRALCAAQSRISVDGSKPASFERH